MFAVKAIPKLISYINNGYPKSIFDEDDEYEVGETIYTRDQYDEAAKELVELINTNNKKSADTLRNEIAQLMERRPILIGLNQAINNAKC
jgi:TolA-binding protein